MCFYKAYHHSNYKKIYKPKQVITIIWDWSFSISALWVASYGTRGGSEQSCPLPQKDFYSNSDIFEIYFRIKNCIL